MSENRLGRAIAGAWALLALLVLAAALNPLLHGPKALASSPLPVVHRAVVTDDVSLARVKQVAAKTQEAVVEAQAIAVAQAAARPVTPPPAAARPVTPSPAPSQAQPVSPPVSTGGGVGGALGACIRQRENGGSYAWGTGDGGGAYQFLYSTWVRYGGAPSEYGHAGPAYQDQIFMNAINAGGASNWTLYDGC